MNPVNDAHTFVVLVLAVITLGYALTCVIWPFKACRRCDGTGKLRSPLIKAIRLCPRCNASGLKLRAGRKAFNAYRHLRRAARKNRQTSGHNR